MIPLSIRPTTPPTSVLAEIVLLEIILLNSSLVLSRSPKTPPAGTIVLVLILLLAEITDSKRPLELGLVPVPKTLPITPPRPEVADTTEVESIVEPETIISLTCV